MNEVTAYDISELQRRLDSLESELADERQARRDLAETVDDIRSRLDAAEQSLGGIRP